MLTKAVIAALIVLASFIGAAAAGRSLPAPDGEYAVGMRRFELTDSKRHGVLSNDPQEVRVLPGYVWYPADKSARGTRPYLTPAEAAIQGPSMARNFDYDAIELKDLVRRPRRPAGSFPSAAWPSTWMAATTIWRCSTRRSNDRCC